MFFSTLSCFKDPSVELPKKPPTLFLSEFKSDDEVTRFEYNSDSSLKMIFFAEDPVTNDQNVTYTIKYLNNKKVDELVGSNGTRVKLTYNNLGISKSEIFDGVDIVSRSKYTYIGDNVSSTTVENFRFVIGMIPAKWKVDFTNNSLGNTSGMKFYSFNVLNQGFDEELNASFQFDDKINPFASVGDLMLIFWQYANKSNITRQETREPNGVITELIESTYSYNSYGYPTKAIMKITEKGMPPISKHILFTY